MEFQKIDFYIPNWPQFLQARLFIMLFLLFVNCFTSYSNPTIRNHWEVFPHHKTDQDFRDLEIKSVKSETGSEKDFPFQKLIEKSERLELKRQVAKEMAQAYELLNEPGLALTCWGIFGAYTDSIDSELKLRSLKELQTRIESIEKDRKIIFQEAAPINLIAGKNRIFVILSAFSLLAVFAAYYWFRIWESKHRVQIQTAQQKTNIHPLNKGSSLDFVKADKKNKSKLTSREKEIILLVEKGKTNQDIARELFVSKNTVKTHLKNIFSKTDAKTRTDLLHKLRTS